MHQLEAHPCSRYCLRPPPHPRPRTARLRSPSRAPVSRELVGWARGEEAAGLTHGELEARLEAKGRNLLRTLLQDHVDLRAQREPRLERVIGADGVARNSVEDGHGRALRSVFGMVTVSRLAYRRKGHANLHPADTALNSRRCTLPHCAHCGCSENTWIPNGQRRGIGRTRSSQRLTGEGFRNALRAGRDLPPVTDPDANA